jgi:hypothetical protein
MWDWLENVSLCCDMGLVGKYSKYVPKYSKYVTLPQFWLLVEVTCHTCSGNDVEGHFVPELS